MNQAITGRTLQFVQIASTFAKRAGDELGVHRQQQKRASDLRPALLQQMLDAGVIEQGSKEACDAMLGSHAETMQLLSGAVEKIAELRKNNAVKTASDLGAPDGGNVGLGSSVPAGAGGEVSSLETPFVGGRYGDNVKVASDEALRKILHS